MCIRRKITENQLWSWFIDIVDKFEFNLSTDGKIRYVLKDQFGNERYKAVIDSNYEGLTVTISCGVNTILSHSLSYKNPFGVNTYALEFTQKIIRIGQEATLKMMEERGLK